MINSIILTLWLPQATYQVLTWIYWWQDKEYRLDRFKILLSSSGGMKRLWLAYVGIKLLVLLHYAFSGNAFPVILVLLFLNFVFFQRFLSEGLRRPIFTQRARRILGTTVLLILIATLFSGVSWKLLMLGEIFLLLGPFLGIVLTIPVVNKAKKREIVKAKKRLKKIKPKVIGITGSYGKGTTKEFLAQLLSQTYKVEKTIGSENTDFGIARKAQKIKEDTEFFIVEMGAYKCGEINKLCDIVSPEIGIITGIEEQHLALFGSLENIRKTKFELVENLPKDGVVIFNLNNTHCRQLAEKAKKLSTNLKVMGFYFQDMGNSKVVKADMVSKLISVNTDGVVFEIREKEDKQIISAPLYGTHFIENLTGAILMARYFGVSWKQIEKSCKTIKAPERTMQVYKLGKAIVIDDTFNNTPKGFEAALSYLSLYKKKRKAVITPGIIELGNESVKVHKKLGKIMSGFVDKIILTNTDSVDAVEAGLGDNKHKLVVEKKPDRLIELVGKLIDDNFVILLEGRMPSILMTFLKKNKNKQ